MSGPARRGRRRTGGALRAAPPRGACRRESRFRSVTIWSSRVEKTRFSWPRGVATSSRSRSTDSTPTTTPGRSWSSGIAGAASIDEVESDEDQAHRESRHDPGHRAAVGRDRPTGPLSRPTPPSNYGKIRPVAFHKINDPERLHALIDAILLIETDADFDGLLATDHRDGESTGRGALRRPRRHLARRRARCRASSPTDSIDRERAAIGPEPHGQGVLGEIIRRTRPCASTTSPSTKPPSGFPPNHPPMTRFLGVPVSTGDGHVFGNLYLTDRIDGRALQRGGRTPPRGLRSRRRPRHRPSDPAQRTCASSPSPRSASDSRATCTTRSSSDSSASDCRCRCRCPRSLDDDVREPHQQGPRRTRRDDPRDPHHDLRDRPGPRHRRDARPARDALDQRGRHPSRRRRRSQGARGIDQEVDDRTARTTRVQALREILSNIVRHSEATAVEVKVDIDGRISSRSSFATTASASTRTSVRAGPAQPRDARARPRWRLHDRVRDWRWHNGAWTATEWTDVIRLLLVDDHEIVRRGLRELLEAQG